MAHTFFANSIGHGIDVYLDKIWIDSVSKIVRDFFEPPMEGTWYAMFTYAIGLTLIALLVKWFISVIADFFEPDVKPTKAELELLKSIRHQNAERESTPI